MADKGHEETEKLLKKMEKQLDEVYKKAYTEARDTATSFMAKFRVMDEEKRKLRDNGDIDNSEYQRWRRTMLFQGKRYKEMADTLAADMTKTNVIAASVINGHLPEVYAINHNYGTYEIEHGGKINTQYSLYDRQTVERLIRDNPDLLPRKAAINIPKDELWNKKHINSAVMQGIIQGKTVDDIAKNLAATVTDMSHTSAIRNARTMTTSAQNGGRIDSYKRAQSMGVKLVQVWMATLDSRTRHEHRQLDGQKRPIGTPFKIDGMEIEFPGDPKAEPYLVYNCRCTLVGEVEGVDYNLSDVTERDSKLGDMSYEEWKEEKKKQDNAEPAGTNSAPQGKTVENNVSSAKINKKSLDNGDNSSIIKSGHKMAADDDFKLPDKVYEVKEDKEQVEASYKYAKEVLGVGNVKFDKLKNNEVIQPMLEQLNELKTKHKKGFYQIFIEDTLEDNVFAEVSPDLALHLNAKYMNSAEATADLIKNMKKSRSIPKEFDSKKYMITHEYMHFISRSELDNIRSKAQKVIPDKQTRDNSGPSFNSRISINEYAADAMAVIELGNKDKYKESNWNLWSKIYNYFFKE